MCLSGFVTLAILILFSVSETSDATCGPGHFTCTDGECIPMHSHCDYDGDCKDYSDEKDCCMYDRFKCANKKCIPMTFHCDFDDDCGDNSDEENCGFPPGSTSLTSSNSSSIRRATCGPDSFTCATGKCILMKFHCDTHNDCGDNSDEQNCGHCERGFFTCANFRCIIMGWHCNSRNDCGDNSDEQNCGFPPSSTSLTSFPTGSTTSSTSSSTTISRDIPEAPTVIIDATEELADESTNSQSSRTGLNQRLNKTFQRVEVETRGTSKVAIILSVVLISLIILISVVGFCIYKHRSRRNIVTDMENPVYQKQFEGSPHSGSKIAKESRYLTNVV